MKFFNDAKLRAGQKLREWKEKREERKQAAAAIHSEHGHGRFFLLTVPATATIAAAIVEVYWAFLFCIEATGHLLIDWSTSVGSDAPASGSAEGVPARASSASSATRTSAAALSPSAFS